MIICGFDPGQLGGLAILEDDKPLLAIPLPIVAKRVDVTAVMTYLNMYEPDRVIVERQQIRQGQGGGMAIGTNYGRLLACIEMAGLPYKEVMPAVWKKKAQIPVGVKGREKKEASYECCLRTFGADAVREIGFSRKKDGPTDAALIGYYG